MHSLVLTLVLLLTLATSASASDGVLEINQACATSAGGCFPGDSAGWPVTITQQGSYRLTGNLSLPLNTTAIQIDSINVTVDLGGFQVSGPNVCTGYPVSTCTVVSGAPGIVTSVAYVVVRNGSVTGMGGDCVSLVGPSNELDHVRASSCGHDGIFVGPVGRVTNSLGIANYRVGIMFNDGGAFIQGNEARANGYVGIMVANSYPGGNNAARLSSSVVENRTFDNAVAGIIVETNTLLSRNVSSFNPTQISAAGRSLGDNLCNSTLC
jgi:hypothetical protein